MKFSIAKNLLLPLATLLFCASALGQTPDGETPAIEEVCNDLIGATPGLYGLCVAFCEAQDNSSWSVPITQEELDDLLTTAPAGRILTNYNKKKTPDDPDMPCINVVDPCPCAIEGLFDAIGSGDTTNYTNCDIDTDYSPFYIYTRFQIDGRFPRYTDFLVTVNYLDDNYIKQYGEYFCHAWKRRSATGESQRKLGYFMTFEEYTACKSLVTNTAELYSVTCE